MITRSQIETRFEKVAGEIGQCGVNSEMEGVLAYFTKEVAKDVFREMEEGNEPILTLKDLEDIAVEYFYEDYLVTFKNKRVAKSKAKARVKEIIEYTIRGIQR